MYLCIYTKLSNFFTFDHWSSTEHNSILDLDLKDIRGKEAFLMPRQLFSQDMDILWTNFLNHFSSICVLCTMHRPWDELQPTGTVSIFCHVSNILVKSSPYTFGVQSFHPLPWCFGMLNWLAGHDMNILVIFCHLL